MGIVAAVLLASTCAHGQIEVKVFGEQADGGIVIYANSQALCPVSAKLEFDLTNMETVEPLADFYVIPAGAEKFKIVQLRPKDIKKAVGYRSRIEEVLGDVGIKSEDKTYVYDLPFEKNARYGVFQGYNGMASHQNQFALDFAMPEGTSVLAAREGTVVRVEKSNTKSCPKPECGQFNNYVLVYHADGSFAEYTHLQKDGARVKKGDKVKKGTLVGISGNTGWTSGPHLHFVCFLQRMGWRETFPTKFRTGDGSTVEQLEEKATYDRKY